MSFNSFFYNFPGSALGKKMTFLGQNDVMFPQSKHLFAKIPSSSTPKARRGRWGWKSHPVSDELTRTPLRKVDNSPKSEWGQLERTLRRAIGREYVPGADFLSKIQNTGKWFFSGVWRNTSALHFFWNLDKKISSRDIFLADGSDKEEAWLRKACMFKSLLTLWARQDSPPHRGVKNVIFKNGFFVFLLLSCER